MMQPEDLIPMHPTLKARVLEAARRQRAEQLRLEAEAKAIVLCPPDCPERHPRFPHLHAHTYWDMIRLSGEDEYGWKMRQRAAELEGAAQVDPRPHLARAGVGETHLNAMAKLDMDRLAIVAAKRWRDQPRTVEDGKPGPRPFPWLALFGDTKTGKTQAAVALLSYFARHHPWNQLPGGGDGGHLPPFVYAHGFEIGAISRDLSHFGAGESARRREAELRRAKVLVLDEVGGEKLDPAALSLFLSLMDERYRHRRITILTGNMTLAQFQERFDGAGEEGSRGRLYRRLREVGACVQLEKRSGRMWFGEKEVLGFGQEVKP